MNHLLLDIDPDEFKAEFARVSVNSGATPLANVATEIVLSLLARCLEQSSTSGHLLRYRVRLVRPPFRHHGPPDTLSQIISHPTLELGYFTVSATASNSSPFLDFASPVTLKLLEPPEIKRSVLKTVLRYTIRLRSVAIDSHLLDCDGRPTCEDGSCPADSLIPYIEGVWDWALRFICKFCGRSYFCECFRIALQTHVANAKAQLAQYSSDGGWPQQFLRAYSETSFRPGICHLCTDSPSDLFFCHPMYGSKVLVRYGPYIYKMAAEKRISRDQAENDVRDLLGIPRIGEGWLSEAELLHLVQAILKDEQVVHQASPNWLGQQRLDIFVPSLGVAIEYQGRQHYESVPFFGGEEGLEATRARDERKGQLCAQNGVRLIYFRYDETITPALVKERIRQARAPFRQ